LTSDAPVRERLERWVRGATTPQRVARRSRIALLGLDGLGCDEIAARVGVSRATARLWVERFTRGGPEALLRDAPGRGRRALLDPLTLRDRLSSAHLLNPTGQPTSLRRAAAHLRVSPSALWRALRRVRPAPRSIPPEQPA
jgi:transposase